jgi:nucleoside-diphosphate-sugar epimerase
MGSRAPVLILGCGYTGRRAAAAMARRGHIVFATSRHPERLELPPEVKRLRVDLQEPESLSSLSAAPDGCLALVSIPVIEGGVGEEDGMVPLLEALRNKADRVVYLSTTGVYGAQRDVDETTAPAPNSISARLRVAAERMVLEGPWSSMVLRPAAIYGPGRGIHVSLPRGEFKLAGDGSNWVSRIHVSDLAALCGLALASREGGCWPVADAEPARSADIARFVCDLLGCPPPGSRPVGDLHETRRANRKVNGAAVLRLLNHSLLYPSYRQGIPDSLDPDALKC